jgi:hypothetical protein
MASKWFRISQPAALRVDAVLLEGAVAASTCSKPGPSSRRISIWGLLCLPAVKELPLLLTL